MPTFVKGVEIADLERFIQKLRILPNSCWLWTGGKDKKGYGKFWWAARTGRAHRFALLVFRGYLLTALEPDHLCRNTSCVNPDHFEWVTKRENLRRGNSPVGINARKHHCIRGHLFNKKNTRITEEGHRTCRICQCNAVKKAYWRNPDKYRKRARAYKAKKHA